MGGEESRYPSSDGFASGSQGRGVLHLASDGKIQSGFTSGSRPRLRTILWKEVRHQNGDKGPKQKTNYGILEDLLMTIGGPLLFSRPLSGSAPLAVRSAPDLLKGQAAGFVPRRTLVSFLGDIGRLSILGWKIIDRP